METRRRGNKGRKARARPRRPASRPAGLAENEHGRGGEFCRGTDVPPERSARYPRLVKFHRRGWHRRRTYATAVYTCPRRRTPAAYVLHASSPADRSPPLLARAGRCPPMDRAAMRCSLLADNRFPTRPSYPPIERRGINGHSEQCSLLY